MYKAESKKLPKYFEIGTVVPDRFNRRENLKKGQKKNRLLDEFKEADGNIGSTKKKFKEIQLSKLKTSRNKKWIKLKRAVLKGDGKIDGKKIKLK